MAVSASLLQNTAQRLLQNPLAVAAVLYITGIIGILVFSYFVTREWL